MLRYSATERVCSTWSLSLHAGCGGTAGRRIVGLSRWWWSVFDRLCLFVVLDDSVLGERRETHVDYFVGNCLPVWCDCVRLLVDDMLDEGVYVR
jgi:hypothetical protein